MSVAPQRSNRAATVDLPEAMLPVKATFSIDASYNSAV